MTTIFPHNHHLKKKRKRTLSRSSKKSASWTNKILFSLLHCTLYLSKLVLCTLHRILMTRFVPSLSIKILFLVCPLAFVLYIWKETDENHTTLAVIIALQRHLPAKRVFDCMLEFSLVGFCAAFAVYTWERTFYERLTTEEQDRVWNILEIIPDDENDDDDDDDVDEDAEEKEELGHVELSTLDSTSHRGSIHSSNLPAKRKWSTVQRNRHSTSQGILHATIDLLLLILVALFLFTMSETVGRNFIDEMSSPSITSSSSTKQGLVAKLISRIGAVAAPIFPLLLFIYVSIHFLFIPWTRTKARLWTLVSYTVTSPLYPVTFRDGLVGDIITSLVRPLQDAVFTLVYLLCGLRGWWIYSKIPDAVQTELLTSSAMESSWIIHTLLLPACIISPLWWRYVQTLRQVYQYRCRWPYLGNSGKYFCAAQIAILGMMYPEWRSSHSGIFFFILVTMYQVCWDIFMDWELLVWKKDGISLRDQRIFRNTYIYYFILSVNILLRFCWTMTFVPSRYLSRTSGLLMYTFSADFSTFKGPALASAEIIRRTLWTLLRVETEVLKAIQRPSLSSSHGVDLERNFNDENVDGMIMYRSDQMTPMPIMHSYRNNVHWHTIKTHLHDMIPNIFSTSTMNSVSELDILKELFLYATMFISFGIVAVIYRGVM